MSSWKAIIKIKVFKKLNDCTETSYRRISQQKLST